MRDGFFGFPGSSFLCCFFLKPTAHCPTIALQFTPVRSLTSSYSEPQYWNALLGLYSDCLSMSVNGLIINCPPLDCVLSAHSPASCVCLKKMVEGVVALRGRGRLVKGEGGQVLEGCTCSYFQLLFLIWLIYEESPFQGATMVNIIIYMLCVCSRSHGFSVPTKDCSSLDTINQIQASSAHLLLSETFVTPMGKSLYNTQIFRSVQLSDKPSLVPGSSWFQGPPFQAGCLSFGSSML